MTTLRHERNLGRFGESYDNCNQSRLHLRGAQFRPWGGPSGKLLHYPWQKRQRPSQDVPVRDLGTVKQQTDHVANDVATVSAAADTRSCRTDSRSTRPRPLTICMRRPR